MEGRLLSPGEVDIENLIAQGYPIRQIEDYLDWLENVARLASVQSPQRDMETVRCNEAILNRDRELVNSV